MRANLLTLLAAVAIAAGCGSGSTTSPVHSHPAVPAEFLPACGHPGASVHVLHVPVTVRHADCDLTGVIVSYQRHGGAVVGSKPGGVGNSQGFTVAVARHTLDVTINARGPVGNA
jgi:hypothetical protein